MLYLSAYFTSLSLFYQGVEMHDDGVEMRLEAVQGLIHRSCRSAGCEKGNDLLLKVISKYYRVMSDKQIG